MGTGWPCGALTCSANDSWWRSLFCFGMFLAFFSSLRLPLGDVTVLTLFFCKGARGTL